MDSLRLGLNGVTSSILFLGWDLPRNPDTMLSGSPGHVKVSSCFGRLPH